MNKRCLYCYQLLTNNSADFHTACSRKFFGSDTPPALNISNDQMQDMAKEIVLRSVAVTGVQPKLSLTIEQVPGDPKKSRFTIVGLWGNYILKPPTPEFQALPENEDLTMHLASLFDVPTADHSLIRLQSGELAYITKRFDRINGEKLALEDMCQLTETLTNDKYHSSTEKIGKAIAKYSTQPGLDAIHFFELVLFCFLTGNADMHLKNFSLLTTSANEIVFSPAYDLLCTRLAIPEDKEEMALPLNGRKRKLTTQDFEVFAKNLKIPDKTVRNIQARFKKCLKNVDSWVDISFLPDKMKPLYKEIVFKSARQVGMSDTDVQHEK
ncbi:MAG: toxin HipA [Bacteroidetes bacterium]|nr:MAG: toxin HipA [Bacteroidota bacterium]